HSGAPGPRRRAAAPAPPPCSAPGPGGPPPPPRPPPRPPRHHHRRRPSAAGAERPPPGRSPRCCKSDHCGRQRLPRRDALPLGACSRPPPPLDLRAVSRFSDCFLLLFGQLAVGGLVRLAVPPFHGLDRGFYRSD